MASPCNINYQDCEPAFKRIAELAENHPAVIEHFVRTSPPVPPVPPMPVSEGLSKASIARGIMSANHAAGLDYETTIIAIMHATGHNRQVARATYAANRKRCNIPN